MKQWQWLRRPGHQVLHLIRREEIKNLMNLQSPQNFEEIIFILLSQIHCARASNKKTLRPISYELPISIIFSEHSLLTELLTKFLLPFCLQRFWILCILQFVNFSWPKNSSTNLLDSDLLPYSACYLIFLTRDIRFFWKNKQFYFTRLNGAFPVRVLKINKWLSVRPRRADKSAKKELVLERIRRKKCGNNNSYYQLS